MKIPEPRKLKSGSYFIQLRLDGVSVPVTASSAKECKRQAELIKAEHRAGVRQLNKSARDLTLLEAETRYLLHHKPVLSPSTFRAYDIYKDKRFPAYQHKRLTEIDWQAMINEELAKKSEKTVKNAWGLVHASLVHVGYPVPSVKLAKVPVKEIPFLQPEEILPFCEAVKGRPYEIAALLELNGLRLSEARGLTWDKIDIVTPEKESITVQGATVRGVGGYVDKETNKNRSSTRVVPILIPQLIDALAAVKDKSGKVVKQAPQTLSDDINRACERAGVTVVGNHGLRHSFASLGYHLGIPERQIMEWGGWSDFTTMHKVYIRLAASDRSLNQARVKSFFEKENANENANSISKA